MMQRKHGNLQMACSHEVMLDGSSRKLARSSASQPSDKKVAGLKSHQAHELKQCKEESDDTIYPTVIERMTELVL